MLFLRVSAVGRCAVTVRPSFVTQFRNLSRHTKERSQARSTLSKIWVPTGGVSATEGETGHGKLIRAGFLRQAQSGIFHLLPLGLRVQNKIEALLDKHMESIGASRLSLSTITSEELWRQSGRLDKVSPELFRLTDRKQVPIMLSPTHEEEITTLVASTMNSYKDLPLRLYQTTRKYRDEMRPRHGLLRSREFVMKDLYTFDTSFESAIETYRAVSDAYRAFFADLKLPVLVAEASSGDMGGDHSHEYHLANSIGEDTIISCDVCDYTANDEVASARPVSASSVIPNAEAITLAHFQVWRGVTKDRKTLINAWYPAKGSNGADTEVNIHAARDIVPELDASINDPVQAWKEGAAVEIEGAPNGARVINLVDVRLQAAFSEFKDELQLLPKSGIDGGAIQKVVINKSPSGQDLNLLRLMDGDGCPRCSTGSLQIHRALELGHTFFLGTRYSDPLELSVTLPNSSSSISVQMGCYGIGVSRIFGAVAEHKADDKGLNWPRAIAPFEIAVIPTSGVTPETLNFYDNLTKCDASGRGFDAVLDDRNETFGWKMRDADIIGYPVTIILGKLWREKGICEVQCRSLSARDNVGVEDLPAHLEALLAQL